MKKITYFLAAFLAIGSFTKSNAAINTATAWWNGETFESFTPGTDFKAAGANVWNLWSTSYYVQSMSVTTSTTGSATGNVLGLSTSNITAFTEISQGGGRTYLKNDFPTLTGGYVYGKTCYYEHTSGYSQGVTYSLKNSSGGIVFEFGGSGSNSNNLWITGVDASTMALGARAKWQDIEFVLDLDNNKASKVTVTYEGTSKTYTDIALNAGGDLNTLLVSVGRGWAGAGLDNSTLGKLIADNIKTLDGASSLQTLSSENVTSDFNVTSFTTAMALDFNVPQTDLDVTWSISDFGTLSVSDQALVSLTRSTTDFTKATLSAGNISADGTITLKAVYGSTELTKQVLLKSLSIEGLKSGLADEITAANALMAAVTDSNPYITGLKSTLSGSVDAGQTVIDNGSATISDATTAMSNLQTAEATFTAFIEPYNAFVIYIGTVQDVYDAETRTANFITTVKGTLNTALGNATTSRTTISIANDIATAKTALETALTQYQTDIPAYASLETQIATVDNRLTVVIPRTGDGSFLMFPTATTAALSSAKTTAESVLAAGTTATELSNAETALLTALTTFNSAERVAPSSTNYYKIYTYGVDGGDGNAIKKILYIDGAVEGLGGTLKYTEEVNTTELTDKYWKITEVSSGIYNLQSKLSSTYLGDKTLADVAAEFSFTENASQGGDISVDEGFFLYSMLNTSANRFLEVDLYDGTALNGVFYNSSITATRLRFCFQFEEVSTSTAVNNTSDSSIKVYTANNNAIIEGMNSGDSYVIYNTLGAIVKSGIATSSKVEVKLAASGIYLVKTGNQIFKLIK